ncbi:hypothetical protein [Methylocella silvestris]|uniref:Uncharacterized protein n=1 Tax=Methylocella silvestris TaxID=199596 RepID=A0A2J7TD80_METSI|nr:hypothetical protein [Methylocella silvestris]PNG24718.1 hypothetical protein CR492_17070 [Methylocella silvestris]
MTAELTTDLVLGSLGVKAGRSAISWLRENGSLCRAGEAIGFCSLALDPSALRSFGGKGFAGEDVVQAVFAAPFSGHLDLRSSEAGGLLDQRVFEPWRPDDIACRIEGDPGDAPLAAGAPRETRSAPLRLLLLAGRRIGWPLDAGAALLPGLYSRARAWWGDKIGDAPTLLSFGLCDATGFVRGQRSAFIELFESSAFPAHIVHVSEKPLTPCATILLEQLGRTPEQARQIGLDLSRSLFDGRAAPQPADLIFAGALLQQLGDSPLRDRHAVFDRNGIVMTRPAVRILMSASAEPRSILRHKQLGYHIDILPENARAAGPAIRGWLRSAFEPVRRALSDMLDDYARLADAVAAATGARLLIVNRMSTSGREDIISYAPFDAPLGQTLAYVAGKELNLMLHDLAATRDVGILDVDAIAAEIGGARHLSDGIHQSEEMQELLRREVLHVLAA